MSKDYFKSFFEEQEQQLNNNGGNPPNYTYPYPYNHPVTSPEATWSPINNPPNVPTYQPSEIPTYHPTDIPIYKPSAEHYPTGYFPNPHPSYHFLSNIPIKEEPKSPSDWMQCHSDQSRWHTGNAIVDTVSTQHDGAGPSTQPNEAGPSRKPRIRIKTITAEDTIHMTGHTDADWKKLEDEKEWESAEEESEPELWSKTELEEETDEEPEEESEPEPKEETEPEEESEPEEYPDNLNEVAVPVEPQTPSYGSVDPYIQFLHNLKGQVSTSFPPYQGEIPSPSAQAHEIQEQNEAADAFFNNSPAETETPPYPNPRDHYDVVMIAYRDPPARYGYPTDIPRSHEEHLDQALQETDELRKKIAHDKKKKEKVGNRILRKCNKLTKVVKKFIRD